MDKMVIEEGNMIAEFMGWEIHQANVQHGKDFCTYWKTTGYPYVNEDGINIVNDHLFCFHEEANWIIPVIERAEGLRDIDVLVLIEGLQTEVRVRPKHAWFEPLIIWSGIQKSKQDSMYRAMVKFINWYNKNILNQE